MGLLGLGIAATFFLHIISFFYSKNAFDEKGKPKPQTQ